MGEIIRRSQPTAFVIGRWMWDQRGLNLAGAELRVYAAIYTVSADGIHSMGASYTDLSSTIGFSRRRTIEATHRLEESSLIKSVGTRESGNGGNKITLWVVCSDPIERAMAQTPTEEPRNFWYKDPESKGHNRASERSTGIQMTDGVRGTGVSGLWALAPDDEKALVTLFKMAPEDKGDGGTSGCVGIYHNLISRGITGEALIGVYEEHKRRQREIGAEGHVWSTFEMLEFVYKKVSAQKGPDREGRRPNRRTKQERENLMPGHGKASMDDCL